MNAIAASKRGFSILNKTQQKQLRLLQQRLRPERDHERAEAEAHRLLVEARREAPAGGRVEIEPISTTGLVSAS